MSSATGILAIISLDILLIIKVYLFQQNIYLKLHVNEDFMPKFLLPKGRWRLWTRFDDGDANMGESSVTFEIVEYSSEKQKKKLG